MKPVKYTFDDTDEINLGTKVIYKYPTPTKDFDIGHMVVDGRHPADPDHYIIEHDCSFIMYILKGTGTVTAGDSTFNVKPKDVVVVPKENKFAVEGQLEYITFDNPAFYMEQSEEITT